MTGEQLRRWRSIAGFTQKSLGEALGYEGRNAEVMVQMWETERRPVNIKHYRKLSRLLRVPLDEMIPPEEEDY